MKKLHTEYAGLQLKNPLIVGSSSLMGNIKNLKKLEKLGAAAVVLKSIYEEEITNEFDSILKEAEAKGDKEYLDYFDAKIKNENLSEYINFIKEAKKEINIPVIASVNCYSMHEWTYFAKKIEEAGADAIELNIFNFPLDFEYSSKKMEKRYLKIIKKVVTSVNIPVVVKMSQYFTNLGMMIKKVSKTGVSGITLFNRFYQPDINLKTNELVNANIFSTPEEYVIPLQWMALMNPKIDTKLAASTGIHDGESFVKLLLAGASANYIVSSLFKNGFEVITEILTYLEKYLNDNKYETVNDIIGLLSQRNIKNPKHYERAQFMKHFTDSPDVV